MKTEIVQGLLLKLTKNILTAEEFAEYRKYFQTMAKYKYDGYKQFSPGMRFIERFSLWLNQFQDEADRKIALDFIKNKLVFISGAEMDLFVSSCFPDTIKPIIIEKIAKETNTACYKINEIVNSDEYKVAIRQSLFCGLSDGARTEIFRRANTGVITHEQVYQTYELSGSRAHKMQEELANEVKKVLPNEPTEEEKKFKMLFLLDDFSASGTSYLKFNSQTGELKGKINALYKNLYDTERAKFKDVFDLDKLEVHIILYLCTEQAKNSIEENFEELAKRYQLKMKPVVHVLHLIPNGYKLSEENSAEILSLCKKDDYYNKEGLEDKHTGEVRLGYSNCALPIIIYHNSPNNSISILWAYENENEKFEGLFPRVPRHKEL